MEKITLKSKLNLYWQIAKLISKKRYNDLENLEINACKVLLNLFDKDFVIKILENREF